MTRRPGSNNFGHLAARALAEGPRRRFRRRPADRDLLALSQLDRDARSQKFAIMRVKCFRFNIASRTLCLCRSWRRRKASQIADEFLFV